MNNVSTSNTSMTDSYKMQNLLFEAITRLHMFWLNGKLLWNYLWPIQKCKKLTENRETPYTVNVLKCQTVVACQRALHKQRRPRSDCFWRSSLVRVFAVLLFWQAFCEFQPWKQIFYLNIEISVQNFRTLTVSSILEQIIPGLYKFAYLNILWNHMGESSNFPNPEFIDFKSENLQYAFKLLTVTCTSFNCLWSIDNLRINQTVRLKHSVYSSYYSILRLTFCRKSASKS